MASVRPIVEPALIEPVPIVEEFASGLAFLEVVGDVTFLIFYVDQIMPPEIAGPRSRRIVRKMIMPNDARERMRRMLEAVDDTPAQPQGDRAAGHH